jgi:hypothetical protein
MGLGASSPSAKLDVYLGDNVTGTIARFGGYNDGRALVFSNSNIGNDHFINAQASGGSITFQTGSIDRAKIDSSGRVLINSSTTPSGATLLVRGGPGLTNAAHLQLTSATSPYGGGRISVTQTGGGLEFFTHTGNVGSETYTERMRIQSNGFISLQLGTIFRSTTAGFNLGSTGIYPTNNAGTNTDNSYDLGSSNFRWRTVYAGTGTINTSDANLKQDVEDLDAAELSVATAIKGLIKKFRFMDAVAAKGDNARIHVGVIAQEVEQAFMNAGLDPRRYGMFCEDDMEDGTKRLGIRYDELLAFVIAAL